MAGKRGNAKYFNNPPKTSLPPVGVRIVDKDMYDFVMSLSNRGDWLREAIAEKYARENQQSSK